MSTTLVSCSSCEREWHSAAMADGLRALGSCPRCNGELIFADAAAGAIDSELGGQPRTDTAPHLVLGVPRR